MLRCQQEKEERAQGTEEWLVRAEKDPEAKGKKGGSALSSDANGSGQTGTND